MELSDEPLVRPSRDARLQGYLVVVVALIALALLFGRPALLVGALPFAFVLARGLTDRSPLPLGFTYGVSASTLLEGDDLEIELTAERPANCATHIRLDLTPAFATDEPADLHLVELPSDAPARAQLTIRPTWWGRLSPGYVELTHLGPSGLMMWESTIRLAADLRVFPPPERVRELLPPPSSHALLGAHASPRVGDGFDFAELRPYLPGDRLRDVNWRATARYGEPHVNRRHPERNGEVLVLLDTFADAAGSHSVVVQSLITKAARAAWAVTRLHLAANDRVGLASRGWVARQIPAGGGDRARYRLLEALLDVGGEVAGHFPAARFDGRLKIPPTALVVVLTPLIDHRMTTEVLAMRAGGRDVSVIVIDAMAALPPPVDEPDRVARRLFDANLQLQRDRLANEGVPITVWADDSSLSQVVASLRHLRRARLVRR